MAVTKISDVIQPELFTQYVIDRTTEKSEIMNAGVIENNPELNQLVTGGGTLLKMRKWSDLTGDSQVMDDTNPISVSGITSKSEFATVLYRAMGWGAHELAGCLAGDDPMKRIGELVSDWWVRDEKKILINILNGVFASTTMSGLVSDISSASSSAISANAVLDAKQLMGDASDMLSMIYMHSATFTKLQKDNVIQFIPVAESKIQIPTYLGYRVVTDDSAPVDTSGSSPVYTTYLLSKGAIQRGIGTPESLTPTEFDRDSAMSTDYLFNRQAKVIHPKGISWVGSANIAGPTPTNAELAVGTNWSRVSDVKKIGMVKLVHTL